MLTDDAETKFLPICPVRVSWGLDETLMKNVSKYRAVKLGFEVDDDNKPILPYEYDNELIIPECRAFFYLTKTGEDGIIPEESGAEGENSMTELFDMWL